MGPGMVRRGGRMARMFRQEFPQEADDLVERPGGVGEGLGDIGLVRGAMGRDSGAVSAEW